MKISAVIITLNEEDRLPDALASLQGVADEVVVVDSYSSDRTVEIARSAQAVVRQNRFEDYGQQKNFAMSQAGCEWILNLDADERVSPELKRAIAGLKAGAAPSGRGRVRHQEKDLLPWALDPSFGVVPRPQDPAFQEKRRRLAGPNPREAGGDRNRRPPGRRHPALHLPRHRRPRAPAGALFYIPGRGDRRPRAEAACSCACSCCRRSHSCAITPGAWACSTASRGWSSPRSQSWATAMKYLKAMALKRRVTEG